MRIRSCWQTPARHLRNSIGLWGWYSFGYWTSTQIYPVTQDIWWLNQYLPRFIGCALLAFVLLCKHHHAPASASKRVAVVVAGEWLSLGLSLAALAILSLVPYTTGMLPFLIVAIACTGIQNAWNIVRWGSSYAQSTAQDNLHRTLVAIIAIACIKLLTLVLPVWGTAILLGVTLVWTHAVAIQDDINPHGTFPLSEPGSQISGTVPLESNPIDGKTLLSLWQTLVSVALFFAIWSFLNMYLVTNVGHITDAETDISWAAVLTQCIDIVFATIMIRLVNRGGKNAVDWSTFWQIAFFVLALGLLSINVMGSTRVAQIFVSAAAVLVFMFTEYLLVQVGRRTCHPAGTVVGVGFACISLIDWVIRGVVVQGGAGADDDHFVPALLLVILFTIVFLLPARSPGMQLLTTELSTQDTVSPGGVDARCRKIAKAHGLSARETEVLTLLARGRSIPYIAETLYLTESTAKTYRQRIYAKLDVHSKQAMLDLVEAGSETDVPVP